MLRVVVRAVCNYIGDHDEQIRKHLPPEHHNKLDAANLACATLVAALDLVIPAGS
jgi:hypothetical protein